MRKVKAAVQTSIDGFMASVDGRTDWMVWNWGPDWTWDPALRQCHVDLTTSSDCVLLSRKMATDGFINHWEAVALHEANPQYAFAKPIADMRKVVCSNTLMQAEWRYTEIAGGDAAETVARLKWEPGKDIDEFHLFVNPTVLGHGKSIWSRGTSPMHLKLESCRSYDCGVVVQRYVPIRPAGRTSR